MIRWPDCDALARAFREARPFAHAVIDGALSPDDHARLAAAFPDEPLVAVENEIYLHLRSPDPPLSAPLRAFVLALQASCAEVSRACGSAVTRADGSAYVYQPGHYLLPHSDAQDRRAIAYAYYIRAPAAGGELELFDGDRVAASIAPAANRLVLFEVHDRAVHQVCEVLEGERWSIAGWFYP